MARIQALLLGLVVVACHTYGQEVERVRTSLIGQPGHALRACLPVPAETTLDGDTELVVYRWTPDTDPKTGQIQTDSQGDQRSWRDRPEREVREFMLDGELPRRQAYCQLTVELRDGLIRGVRSQGRDHRGLNSNASCLMETRDCAFDPEDPPLAGEDPDPSLPR